MTVRVRIAPSPTGDPHIGTAYIGLINQVFARKEGGRFILRIEDTDRARSSARSEAMIFEALRWCGLAWDEGPDVGGSFGPYRQSERLDLYGQYVDALIASGKAYRCFCTAERLSELRATQRANKQNPGYDKHCAGLSQEESARRAAAGEPFVVRLNVDRSGETIVRDRLRGEITFANEQVDDQVLLKSDGYPTYHLANVVDDHLMEITHVIRGEEWISSTPKHVLLYDALGWTPPEFVHLPLLRNADKSKVSKRKNPVSLNYYRDAGIIPAALRNYLARMAWSYPVAEGEDSVEKFTTEAMVDAFTLERISLGGPVFDLAKLTWLNGRYLREDHTPEQLLALLRDHLLSDERLLAMLPLVQERMDRLDEFVAKTDFFFTGDLSVDVELLKPKKRELSELRPALTALVEQLDGVSEWTRDVLHETLKAFCEEQEWKARDLFMPVRIAVTGTKASPGLFETLEVLGKERVRRRLRVAIQSLKAAGH
ncbi:MAG: glutamate--tRNA ligase [Myxococcota bacterium]|nr:glutamate--tRNA ligase [Myxococcota bacterium]